MPYQFEQRAASFTTDKFHVLTTLPHLHTHLEMIYMEKGSSVATVDYQEFRIEAGDLFLAFPNQIHFYHDCSPVEGYLFIFSHDLFNELKKLFQNNVPSSPVIKKEQLSPEILDILNKIREKNNADDYFDKIAAKGHFLGLLGEILPCMTFVPHVPSHDSFRNILTYCSEKYTEPLTLDILARDLHLNKYYISHIFKERMGISFTDFVNGQRIEHACTLLEKGSSIADVAFSSGFSSIRTFNRAFAKYMGMAPRDFLKEKEKRA